MTAPASRFRSARGADVSRARRGMLAHCRHALVRPLLALLMGLTVLVSFGGGTVAHAMEPIAPMSDRAALLLGHQAGDADEVPADLDKNYPHHHASCHGHFLGLPAGEAPQSCPHSASVRLLPVAVAPFFPTEPAALRRPPRA